MKTALYTVPGTGTRFVADVMEGVFGYRHVGHKQLPDHPDALVYTWQHAYHLEDSLGQILSYPNDIRVVSSLREPLLSYATRSPHGTPLDYHVARWKNLIKFSDTHTVLFFPVDENCGSALSCAVWHRHLINRLGRHLGVPVKSEERRSEIVRDWPPLGFSGAGPKGHLNGIIDGVKGELDFAVDWYNERVSEIRQGIMDE